MFAFQNSRREERDQRQITITQAFQPSASTACNVPFKTADWFRNTWLLFSVKVFISGPSNRFRINTDRLRCWPVSK